MVTLNNTVLQGLTVGRMAQQKQGALGNKRPKCPLCENFILDGEKTDFRQIKMNGYTTARRVHQTCPEVGDG